MFFFITTVVLVIYILAQRLARAERAVAQTQTPPPPSEIILENGLRALEELVAQFPDRPDPVNTLTHGADCFREWQRQSRQILGSPAALIKPAATAGNSLVNALAENFSNNPNLFKSNSFLATWVLESHSIPPTSNAYGRKTVYYGDCVEAALMRLEPADRQAALTHLRQLSGL
jgi:hypothetical protein